MMVKDAISKSEIFYMEDNEMDNVIKDALPKRKFYYAKDKIIKDAIYKRELYIKTTRKMITIPTLYTRMLDIKDVSEYTAITTQHR